MKKDGNIPISRKHHFSVDEWCQLSGISRTRFYELMAEGLAPKSFKVGKRRLISAEAAAAWTAQMEANAS